MLTAEQVLDLHTEIMRCYDKHWSTTVFYADTDEKKLNTFKHTVHEATTYSIPSLACLNKNFRKDLVHEEAIAAYNIALKAVKDINNLEDYHRTFRKAYDSAMRIELYRRFLSKVSSIRVPYSVNDISSEADHLSLNLPEFVDSVETQIKMEFAQFQAIESSLEGEDLVNFQRLETQLGEYLQLFNKSLEPFKINSKFEIKEQRKLLSDAALEFEMKAGKLIRGYQLQYEHDLSWAPFLKNLAINLALIATGVGAFVSLGLLIYKLATGRHAFFDKPMLNKRTTPAVEEQILSPGDNDPSYSDFNQVRDEQPSILFGSS